MLKKTKEHHSMRPTRQIALSFFMVILIGSILLTLPISNNGETTSYLNNLFIATSATCVTGLVPVVPAEQYNLFGQLVIIMLIQIGGLGFLTFLSDWRSILLNQQTILKIFIFDVILSILVSYARSIKPVIIK